MTHLELFRKFIRFYEGCFSKGKPCWFDSVNVDVGPLPVGILFESTCGRHVASTCLCSDSFVATIFPKVFSVTRRSGSDVR